LAKIEWTEAAVKDLEKLDKLIALRILNKITWFGRSFEHLIPEPLSGEFKQTYKLRVGDWIVIYTIGEDSIIIQSLAIERKFTKRSKYIESNLFYLERKIAFWSCWTYFGTSLFLLNFKSVQHFHSWVNFTRIFG
jgi:mRNA interferase RelE/StbE